MVELYFNEQALQGRVDFANVITNQTDRDVTVRLEQVAKGLLRRLGHGVNFIEDDEFLAIFEHGLGLYERGYL